MVKSKLMRENQSWEQTQGMIQMIVNLPELNCELGMVEEGKERVPSVSLPSDMDQETFCLTMKGNFFDACPKFAAPYCWDQRGTTIDHCPRGLLKIVHKAPSVQLEQSDIVQQECNQNLSPAGIIGIRDFKFSPFTSFLYAFRNSR
ncbi:hypothetical protein NC652_033145 [Populus alba x Populus x berolinensis]|nr:hypothetical protein NC652_033145 [Populus alba x Populus x berolinensis]